MILYHYCSTETFWSIISNQSIWLSSLSLSNDTMEGKWLVKVFGELLRDEKISEYKTNKMLFHIQGLSDFADGLGFCLSEAGDMLSQWRGYASNASGMCIGFGKDELAAVSAKYRVTDGKGFIVSKVEYSESKQRELLQPVLAKLKDLAEKGAFDVPRNLLMEAGMTQEEKEQKEALRAELFNEFLYETLTLLNHLYQVKNPAFSEELEWRLVSFLTGSDHDCKFRATTDRIIPYREFSLKLPDNAAIKEVIIGPRNISSVDLIKKLLAKHDLHDVKVSRSEATYR
ncbi:MULTISPECIES: DUF2971 domain-containing protein [unclassified Mesorhizobium]|uniref:DUF2971 domain-containing protein n=1 Tax=unclassified Mesorhizobium TaxID=325217 RepID=UPI000FD765D7|nr:MULTISPECIES: DUF2971 domain-containing protein [unclassified Mesorhizobium]TGQ08701.1 DUF2971 domain-containing protein [Mesorhizobium sp. M2E.F.Ca.ET.219.01.1.1]TGT69236.1 DUF2971 domain-containing protein [Mesorhizobium sp. M2E.F.Ca.ET.166.01.1.1]TGW01568.1 DUF2971 domain-containing protein [Mesorhizobium sp. M2E.F.Ca.ET.154.01.1.1]